MSNKAVQRLHQLLETERAALRAGDMDAVHGLTEEKEALLQQFDKKNAQELSHLSKDLARNEALLLAARDGVALVQVTLRQQRAARETLSTYDSTGKATTISHPNRGTERRF